MKFYYAGESIGLGFLFFPVFCFCMNQYSVDSTEKKAEILQKEIEKLEKKLPSTEEKENLTKIVEKRQQEASEAFKLFQQTFEQNKKELIKKDEEIQNQNNEIEKSFQEIVSLEEKVAKLKKELLEKGLKLSLNRKLFTHKIIEKGSLELENCFKEFEKKTDLCCEAKNIYEKYLVLEEQIVLKKILLEELKKKQENK